MNQQSPIFSFGVASDVQYADKEDEINKEGHKKYYRGSLQKINEVIQFWNQHKNLSFTIHLGDIIDGNQTEEQTKKDLDQVLKVFERDEKKEDQHHVIGNHCLRLPRNYILNRMDLNKKGTHYSFKMAEGWRGIILDGSDISTYGWDKDSVNYNLAKKWLGEHPIDKYPSASDWNAGIGEDQKEWIKKELHKAHSLKEKVIVFNHYPLIKEAAAATHLLWNGDDIAKILESKEYEDTVAAFFCGHYHIGGYCLKQKENGRPIHYYTMKGILEAPVDSNFGAIIHVWDDRIEIEGYGSVENQTLEI